MNIMFGVRVLSALASVGILVVVYCMARTLSLSPKVGLAAAAMLSSLIYFQDNGMEMRPDVLQNLLWLTGLFLVLWNVSPRLLRISFLAGFFFGLSMVVNVKAGFGPMFLILYYIFGGRLHGMTFKEVMRELSAIAAGTLLAYFPFIIYFTWHGAISEFLHYNFIFNYQFTLVVAKDWSRTLWFIKYFAFWQFPFVLLVIAGLVCWIADLWGGAGRLDHRKGWLMVVMALGTASGCLLGDWTQIYLVFLPLLAIFASFGLFRIMESLWEQGGVAGRVLATACVMLASGYLFAGASSETPFSEQTALMAQKSLTEHIVGHTEASDSIGVLWNECAGYMFNDTLQYDWIISPILGDVLERIYGEHPFGDAFVAALQRDETRFVIGADGESLDGLPPQSRAYINENFRYEKCLWTRNE
jgi:hypothetical protein